MSIDELKSQLEIERDELFSELKEIATQHPTTGDWVAIPVAEDLNTADQNTKADAVEEWNERRAVLAQLEIRFKNVTRALEKFKTNTYGTCEISGEPIEQKRLEANPAARTNMANIEKESDLPL